MARDTAPCWQIDNALRIVRTATAVVRASECIDVGLCPATVVMVDSRLWQVAPRKAGRRRSCNRVNIIVAERRTRAERIVEPPESLEHATTKCHIRALYQPRGDDTLWRNSSRARVDANGNWVVA